MIELPCPPELWPEFSALLDAALDLPPEERMGWLQTLAPQHEQMRPWLLKVLNGSGRIETADYLDAPSLPGPELSLFHPGQRIGPYVLERELGRGGMGEVWLARRDDGTVNRRIALKLPFAHLPAIALQRFARERDILAGLAHPHIARLYDAGTSLESQPFLAMEYVEGAPIVEHCDAQRMGLPQRLELFTQVLEAVQYAHSRLVIHRDIKPSNILVTAANQIALLDFGIAKLIVDGEAKETELTQYGNRSLTPSYASPEQIAGQPLTTGSDIYSLGVVLCELLSGALPYRTKRESRGALEEAILSVDPVKPSQIASDDTDAFNRGVSPVKLRKAIRGDLDTITLKALHKSASARYLTAQAFEEDIRRYLGNQPVLARPESAIYRAGKFLRRNKLAVGATAGMVLALLVGLALALWQARVARLEAHRAQAVQGFLLDIFRSSSMDQKDPEKGRHTTAQQLLDAGAKQVNDKLKAFPESQELVMDTLAEMYFGMGLSDDAANMRRQRIEVLKSQYGMHDLRVADALLSYAEDLSETAGRGPILAALNEAGAILEARRDSSSPIYGRLLLALTRYYRYVSIIKSRDYADKAVVFFRQAGDPGDLGRALRYAGKTRDALGDYEGGLKWHQEAIDNARLQHPEFGSWMVVLVAELSDGQKGLLQIAEAEKTLRTALELGRKFQGANHLQTLQVQLQLGQLLQQTSRRQEARALLQDALDIVTREDNKSASGETPEVMGFYGSLLLADGRPADAEPYLAADADDLKKNYPGSSPLARRLASQGEMLSQLGRYDEAEKTLAQSWQIWQSTAAADADPAMSNFFLLAQIRFYLSTGQPEHAQELLQRITLPSHSAQLPILLDDTRAKIEYAQSYLQQKRPAEALASAQGALESVQRSPLRAYYQTLEADSLLWLGEAQIAGGDLSAATANLEQALRLRQANDDQNSPWIAQVQIALAKCLLASGNRQRSRTMLASAAAIQNTHRVLGSQFKRPLQEMQTRLAARAH
jgi:hypothetical protein